MCQLSTYLLVDKTSKQHRFFFDRHRLFCFRFRQPTRFLLLFIYTKSEVITLLHKYAYVKPICLHSAWSLNACLLVVAEVMERGRTRRVQLKNRRRAKKSRDRMWREMSPLLQRGTTGSMQKRASPSPRLLSTRWPSAHLPRKLLLLPSSGDPSFVTAGLCTTTPRCLRAGRANSNSASRGDPLANSTST